MTPKPIILKEGEYTAQDVDALRKSQRIWQERDIYQDQLVELFNIENPATKQKTNYQEQRKQFIEQRAGTAENPTGNWIYYPWSGLLIHAVTEQDHETLRTNRNRDLITLKEQETLRSFTVAVAGLSIGNGMALSLVYSGISKTMKVAEFDTLETSNLNRIRAGIHNIGEPKMNITLQQIYDVNPYASLHPYPAGLSEDTLKNFISGEPKPQILLEAIDDFAMKIRLRLAAREAGIPVVMLTNLGDRMLIDVERYDQDSNLPLFNGLIGDTAEEILAGPIKPEDINRYAIQLVGPENIPKRALESVKQIGTTLVGRPQLASTVFIGSGTAAYLVRQIALGEDVPSGRKLVKFDDTFI